MDMYKAETQYKISTVSQVVNGVRLKICSFGFVGSNPTQCNRLCGAIG